MEEPRTAPTPPIEAAGRPAGGGAASPGDRRVVAGFAVVIGVAIGAAAVMLRDVPVTVSHYLLLSMLMFTTGFLGVMLRRNALVLFMCIELMLNAVNVAFVAFAHMHARMEGQVVVLFVMIVAAAEVAVGLAIVVTIFRKRATASVDELSELRW